MSTTIYILTLSYFKGQTVPKGAKLVVNWPHTTKEGMIYVMLGRCERLQDLFICFQQAQTKEKEEDTRMKKRNKLKRKRTQEVDEKKEQFASKIKCSMIALQENESLKSRAIERRQRNAFFEEGKIHIGFMNIRSLRKHWIDFQNDESFKKCQMIGLCETWVHTDEEVNHSNYETVAVNVGRGQGIATFNNIQAKIILQFGSNLLSVIALQFGKWIVVFMYASQGASNEDIIAKLSNLFSYDHIIIVGDMNWDYLRQENPMKRFFLENGCVQLIEVPTHEAGGLLDHVYVKAEDSGEVVAVCKARYYSDHDCLFIKINQQ